MLCQNAGSFRLVVARRIPTIGLIGLICVQVFLLISSYRCSLYTTPKQESIAFQQPEI